MSFLAECAVTCLTRDISKTGININCCGSIWFGVGFFFTSDGPRAA